ncbi:MAG TPA: YbfB/YjiJ family MFS transporter [Chloroflexi bacterium]|nr:YbfB/YjiJ family MFS transporter [Chloroflexota bacterium]
MGEETGRRVGGLHYGWIIAIMSVVTVLGALGLARFGYTMILPSMKEGLGLTDSQAGDLATANMIGYLVMAVTCGYLASRFGPRIVASIFMCIIGASMILTGMAPNFQVALLGRLLTGVGSGGTNVPVMGLVPAWFSAKRRGLATGMAVSGSSFGMVVTGLLVPAILGRYGGVGWRYSWYCLAGFAFVIAVLGYVILRNHPRDKGLAPIGAVETGVAAPVVKAAALQWGTVYRAAPVWHLALIYILFGFSYIIYTTFFARYLTWEAGFTTQAAGALWSMVGIVSVISGFIWGSVSDVVGRKYGLAIVYFLQFLCFTIFGLWKAPTGYYLSALLFALTAWSIPGIMAAASGDLLGDRLAPAALGFITLFFGIGQACGTFIGGRVADLTGSYTLAFVIAGSAALIGAVASLFLRTPERAL